MTDTHTLSLDSRLIAIEADVADLKNRQNELWHSVYGPPPPVVAPEPTDRYPGAKGRGVYAHVVRGNGDKERYRDSWDYWASNGIGSQLSYGWDFLNRNGFDAMKRHIEAFAKHGTNVWIEIASHHWNGAGPPARTQSVIPMIRFTGVKGPQAFPVPWHTIFQHHWFSFLRDVAAIIDGHSNVEFIAISGPWPAFEPHGPLGAKDRGNNDAVKQLWQHGYDGDLSPNGIWYQQAVVPIMEEYGRIFTKTRVAQVAFGVGAGRETKDAIWQLCGDNNYIVLGNGLNRGNDTTEWRQSHGTRTSRYGVDSGFAEWANMDWAGTGVEQFYRQVIGTGGAHSRLSYMPLPHMRVQPGDAEGLKAMNWANENLRNWKE